MGSYGELNESEVVDTVVLASHLLALIISKVTKFPLKLRLFSILIFLLAPQVVKKMQSNGAFEVFLDDGILIFSRLKTGEMPHVDQLVKLLVEAGLKMTQSSEQ